MTSLESFTCDISLTRSGRDLNRESRSSFSSFYGFLFCFVMAGRPVLKGMTFPFGVKVYYLLFSLHSHLVSTNFHTFYFSNLECT